MTWDQAGRAARTGGARGLRDAAGHLLKASTAIAPYERDELIDSASADVDEADLTAAVSYDTEYAIVQHEDLSERHDPGRQGKYLEQPLHDQARELTALIAQGVRRGLD